MFYELIPAAAVVLAATCVSLTCLLFAEQRHSRTGIFIFKPCTSTLFLIFAATSGATQTPYGCAVMVGLALCWVGDILLLLEGTPAFLAGMATFIAGHVSYIVAFRVYRRVVMPDAEAAPVVLAAMLVSMRIARRFLPRWESGTSWVMPLATRVYALVITMMVASAGLAYFGSGSALPAWQQGAGFALAGALLFYVSDLCVAHERFVQPHPLHALIGLPLYYAGQMLLAASVWDAPTGLP